jgi:hypothetical protein
VFQYSCCKLFSWMALWAVARGCESQKKPWDVVSGVWEEELTCQRGLSNKKGSLAGPYGHSLAENLRWHCAAAH